MVAAYRKASSYADQGTVHMLAEADGREDPGHDGQVLARRWSARTRCRVEAYGARLVCDGKRLFAAVDDLPGQVLLTDAPPRLTLRSVYRIGC